METLDDILHYYLGLACDADQNVDNEESSKGGRATSVEGVSHLRLHSKSKRVDVQASQRSELGSAGLF